MREMSKRRWYSYSTRELFLVVVVVAVVLGWLVDRRRLVDLNTTKDRELERAVWNAEALKSVVKASGGHADVMLSGIHAKFPSPGAGMADSWQYFDAESPTTVPEPSIPPKVELE